MGQKGRCYYYNTIKLTFKHNSKSELSSTRRGKSKVFAFQDHSTIGELADICLKAMQKKDKALAKLNPTVRDARIRELKLQKLQHVAALAGMESFEAVGRNNFPKSHHTMLSFVNQNASPEVNTTSEVLVNWNAPIKLELVFLPDSLT